MQGFSNSVIRLFFVVDLSVDIKALAVTGEKVIVDLPLSDCPRLVPSLCSTDGRISGVLQGRMDTDGNAVIDCRLRARIKQTCQRCLEPAELSLSVQVSWGLITHESQAGRLTKEFEPVLMFEGGRSIMTLIEDELLLALPLVPVHELLQQCMDNGYRPVHGFEPQKAPNPFAGLEQMIKR